MAKFRVRTYDAISPVGLRRFSADYTVAADPEQPDAIMLPSFSLHNQTIDETVLAIGRARAGVNNIAVDEMTDRGIVVFNAPGANANSVKGLVVAGLLPPGAVLLNFARDELVDEQAVVAALDAGELRGYVTDFPNPTVHAHDKVIALPHLGASTSSAEDNCAVMIADELQDFLENGNIRYSVNFPAVSLPRRGFRRLTLAHRNTPGVIAEFSRAISAAGLNVVA